MVHQEADALSVIEKLLGDPEIRKGIVLALIVDEEGGVQAIGGNGAIALLFPKDETDVTLDLRGKSFLEILQTLAMRLDVQMDLTKIGRSTP